METDSLLSQKIQANAESLKARFARKPGESATWLSEEKDQKLKQACSDFESVFINMMLQAMRKTLPGDSLTGKSSATDIFESMYDQNLAIQISKSGDGLGISGMAYRDLKTKITGVHEAPVKPPSRFDREEAAPAADVQPVSGDSVDQASNED